MKRAFALLLTLVLLGAAFAVPASAADQYASYRTSTRGASSGRLGNMQRAALAINQVYVASGATFSFNDTVGPRTKAEGYVKALNDRGAKVMGGGVSQVATTLYMALLNLKAGSVAFDEVKTYGSDFNAGYIPDGDYAVVTDYKNDKDFRFTNRTSQSLLIETWFADNYLYCTVTQTASSFDSGNWFATPAPDGKTGRLLGSSSIYCGNDKKLLNNIDLAATTIYDTTLRSGDTFSFNDVVGPRTKEYGYVRAINGRGVETTGGGVAQVASALWLAVKNAGDITVVEKSTYGEKYNQSYVSNSADAILTDYSDDIDFEFRYDGWGSITIYTWTDSGRLYCEIYRNN